MRIAFLTSTPLDFRRGSGTYTGIATLARALETLGTEVQFFTPQTHLPVYTLERLWFNSRLKHTDFRGFDAVVGFDMDGYRLAVPHIASIKGVIADEMRFERGMTHATMALQAACERKHVRNASLVITTSQYAARRIQHLYGTRETPRVVPECIDLTAWHDLFRENPATPDPTKFTVLCVCRFYPRKRLDVLLRAAEHLRSRIRNLEIRIVGGGPEEGMLLGLWHRLHLENTVRWLGDVSQTTLAREYQTCDVFCLPSVQEGFGIAFLEAMAACKPVVAVRAAAVPEVVPDGVAGLLTPPGDEEALARAIGRLHTDPALAKTLGESGRNVVERYDSHRVARLFLNELTGKATLRSGHGVSY